MKYSISMTTAIVAMTVVSGSILAEGYPQPAIQPANEGLYASFFGGANFPSGQWANPGYVYDPVETGGVLGTAIGYRIQQFRAEAEFSFYHNNYRDETSDGFDGVNQVNFMANGYFDMPTHSAFVPYVGAGLGASVYSVSAGSEDYRTSDGTRLAVQGIAGAEYHFNADMGLAAEYRLKYSSLQGNVSSYNNIAALRFNYYF